MSVLERHIKIMIILGKRRYEKIEALAKELNVTERTIRRDIVQLSIYQPIYTIPGCHGGVYVTDDYKGSNLYLSQDETELLYKILAFFGSEETPSVTSGDIKLLQLILLKYGVKSKERRKNE